MKTTPPARGSCLIEWSSSDFFGRFASAETDTLKFFHVGTYEHDSVGVSCYHTSLSIFENILSHTALKGDEYLVADMVAGNDAFSNTLFTQFDILCLVIEPTVESVSLVKNYLSLLEETGTTTRVMILANKVADESDTDYLRDE